MALELSYKGLADQIGVISPNLVRNGFFIADPAVTTRPGGWATTSASGVSLTPGYSSTDPYRGQALTINSSGYIQCDDFISFSGGTEMKGLYQNPLSFNISVFIKGNTSSSVPPTSGLKLEILNDVGTIISTATRYFGYTSAYALSSTTLTLDDSNFSSSYKFKIKLTNIGANTVYLKLLSLTPGDVVPNFFLPSILTEENYVAVKNKPLTINAGTSSLTYDGSTQKTINVVSTLTSSNGLSTNVQAIGDINLENNGVRTITGTANQVLVNSGTSAQTGAVTITLPQSIATTSSPTFANITGANITANGQFSTKGIFLAGTDRSGGSWTSLGWGKIGLKGDGSSGAPTTGEAPSAQPGDFFFRY